ncbi:MAG: amino acid permease, partial [bacterium]|nr:amino acid permease [bacterium]
YPHAGGEYVFLSRLFHPVNGFLSGWVSFFVGFSAPIAASALGFSEYIARAFPNIMVFGPFSVKIYAIIVIIIFTFVHLRGIEFGSTVQNWLTVMKVLLLVGLITLGFMFGKGDFSNLSLGQEFTYNLGGWKTIGLSLMWIMYAYAGWNASAYLGSEIKNPRKNLPYSLIIGTAVVILLYFLLNLLYVYAATPGEMMGVISIGGLVVKNLFGESMETFVSMLISFALFSSLSAYIILGPRIYFAMARDGYFFKFASKIHPVFKIPSKSIMLQCVIAVVMVLSGTFDQLLTYMGFSLGIFPILAVAGVMKLRLSGKSVLKISGFPIVPILYIIPNIIILVLAYLERPVESSIAVATVISGIPLYYYFFKKNGNKSI